MQPTHDDELFAPSAREFLREHIDSVDALELWLLLWRERTRAWDNAALAAELRLRRHVVDRVLRRLGSKNIVTKSDGSKQWSARDSVLEEVAAAVAEAYELKTLDVIRVINELSMERAGRRAKGRVTIRNLRD